MDKLSNFVSKIDFMGIQLKPTLNSNNRIKSLLGGLISIVATVCILFGFVYFGISMIKRDKPIMNVVQEMRPEAVIYTKDNPFMITVYDRYGRIIHNDPGFKRAVSIQTELYQVRPDPEKSYILELFRGTVKPCDRTEVNQKIYDELQSAGYKVETSLCQDSSSFKDMQGNPYKGDIYLKNRYIGINSNYMHYNFVHCDEEKDPGCGEYLESVDRMSVVFYKLDYYIDQTDFSSPIKVDLTQKGYSISKTVSQAVYIPTRINEIVTDSSFFLTEEKKETYYNMMNPSTSVTEYQPKQRVLLEFVISSEMIVNINQRRYLKIPELLANMGGFMKAALVIGNMVSYLYSEYVYFAAVSKLELKFRKAKPIMLEGSSEMKSSANPIKIGSKLDKTQIPSFFEYLKLLFTSKKKLNKQNSFKYLELNYIIDCLLFVEEIKKERENNFVKEDSR